MNFEFWLGQISLGVVLFGALQYITSIWINERLKTSLQKEHSTFLENLKWELKVREQAVRVAEYLALAISLKNDSSDADYQKANQLSWELAMWLPEDIYREMVTAIVKPSERSNALTTVISVRSLLLNKRAGNLEAENISCHKPGVGKKPTSTEIDMNAAQ